MTSPILLFESESPEERAVYANALLASGLRITDDQDALEAIAVERDDAAVVVRSTHQQYRLSRDIAPADLAWFLRLVTELDALLRHFRPTYTPQRSWGD